jgi:hypothetical protein
LKGCLSREQSDSGKGLASLFEGLLVPRAERFWKMFGFAV